MNRFRCWPFSSVVYRVSINKSLEDGGGGDVQSIGFYVIANTQNLPQSNIFSLFSVLVPNANAQEEDIVSVVLIIS